MKPLSVLSKYFNTDNDPPGYTKKTLGDFGKEVKELNDDEKLELATLAAEDMGIELTTA